MVNINIRFPYVVDGAKFTHMICEALKGNRGFIENDIVVCDANEETKSILISLGDDADKNPKRLDITVKVEDVNGLGTKFTD